MVKRGLGLIAVLFALWGGKAEEEYSFGLIGDVHYDAQELHKGTKAPSPEYLACWQQYELPNLEAAARFFAKEPRVEFVLQTGDLVSGCAGTRRLQERMLVQGWRKVRDCFPGMPFYVVNGNHETYNHGTGELYAEEAYAATILPLNAREFGREEIGRHFWFRRGRDLFIAHDSNALEYNYISSALEANPDARWVFVIGHIPVISPVLGGIEIDSPEKGNMMEHHDQLLKLLQSRNAIVLCGDTHRLGMLDFVTIDGRLTQLMGVSVENQSACSQASKYGEFAFSPKDYPEDTPRKRHLKPGVRRLWTAKGSGAWKVKVGASSVRAELIEWARPDQVVKRVVLRGEGDEYEPSLLDLGGFPPRNDLVIEGQWEASGFVYRHEFAAESFATNADVAVAQDSSWPMGSNLELYFDPFDGKRYALDSDNSQVVLFPVAGGRCRSLFVRYPYPPGGGDPWVRFRRKLPVGFRWEMDPIGVEAHWARQGEKVELTVKINWSVIAPASAPDYIPCPGSVFGFNAASGNCLLYGEGQKYWDDPSTWPRIRLKGDR